MEITLIAIITTVLTSSVIAAVLTSSVNYILQKNNYRDDYYKKVLDKRLDALETARILSGILSGSIRRNNGRLCIMILSKGWGYYDSFQLQLYGVIQKSFWLSNDSITLFTDLSIFLVEHIEQKLSADPTKWDLELYELGTTNWELINDFRTKINLSLAKDISTLHQIRKFARNKPNLQPRLLETSIT